MLPLRTCLLRRFTTCPQQCFSCTRQSRRLRNSSSVANAKNIDQESGPLDVPRHESNYINLGDKTKGKIHNHRPIGAQSVLRTTILEDDVENIKGSLEETLQAHRQANKDRLKILRVKNDTPRLQIASSRPRQKVKQIVGEDFKHLELLGDAPKRSIQTRKDYEGRSQHVLMEWQPSPSLSLDLLFPWIRRLKDQRLTYHSALSELDAEIKAAASYLSPTTAEVQAADIAIKDIQDVVSVMMPSPIKVDIIGSRANGLANPLSDIDVNLVVSTADLGEAQTLPDRTLPDLYRQLRYARSQDPISSLISVYFFAAKARIPIIAAVHHPTGLEFQIQSSTGAYNSLEYCKSLNAEFPTLKPLFLIIKHMLKIRGLCNGAQGGISSYPLLNMIATSLKKHAAETDPTDSAQHLLQFLNFFSEIDFYNEGIAYRPSNFVRNEMPDSVEEDLNTNPAAIVRDPVGAIPVVFNVRSNLAGLHTGTDNFMMTLLDPTNPYNDLGKTAYWIKHIQATFLDLREQLNKAMQQWKEVKPSSTDQPAEARTLLAPLIGADYSLFALERKALRSASDRREAVDWP